MNSSANGLYVQATISSAAINPGAVFATAAPIPGNVAPVSPPAVGYGRELILYGARYFLIVLTYVGNYATRAGILDGLVCVSAHNDGDVSAAIASNSARSGTGTLSTVVYAVVRPGAYYAYSQIAFAQSDSGVPYTCATRVQTFAIDDTVPPVLHKAALQTGTLQLSDSMSILGSASPSCFTLSLPSAHYVVLMDATATYNGGSNDPIDAATTNNSLGVDVGLTPGGPAVCATEAEDATFGAAYAENSFLGIPAAPVDSQYPPISAHVLSQAIVPGGTYQFGANFYYTLDRYTASSTVVNVLATAALYAQVIALPICVVPVPLCATPSLPSQLGFTRAIDITESTNPDDVGPYFFLSRAPGNLYTTPLVLRGAAAFVVSIDVLASTSEENRPPVPTSFNAVAALLRSDTQPSSAANPAVITYDETSTVAVSVTTVSCSASTLTIVGPGTYYAFGAVYVGSTEAVYPVATLSMRVLITPVHTRLPPACS